MAVKKCKILVIHGPNLNLLGKREPQLYGNADLKAIDKELQKMAKAKNVTLEIFQSNHEGEIVDKIQNSESVNGIVANFAALTHTSVALRDAVLAVKKPLVEVHLSNVFQREEFRHHSFFSDIAMGVITGFGKNSYVFGLQAMIDHLK